MLGIGKQWYKGLHDIMRMISCGKEGHHFDRAENLTVMLNGQYVYKTGKRWFCSLCPAHEDRF